jgi:large subunit ribosomal protein L25
MREIPLSAQKRETSGKGPARRNRESGVIPGIVYGPEIESFSVAVNEKDLHRALKRAGTTSFIYNLSVNGSENKVVLREIQRDPITSEIMHIDFHAISMNKPLYISIPITFTGTPEGVKSEGGIMQVAMRHLEISCLPKDIPEIIEVNVEELNIGDAIHVSDIELENVDILDSEQRTIVVIAAPTVVAEPAEEEEAEGEEAEGEEGAEGEAGEAAEGEGEEKKEE